MSFSNNLENFPYNLVHCTRNRRKNKHNKILAVMGIIERTQFFSIVRVSIFVVVRLDDACAITLLFLRDIVSLACLFWLDISSGSPVRARQRSERHEKSRVEGERSEEKKEREREGGREWEKHKE